ncbi:MAG: Uma2 family endonuclease [Deinococcota bacterium]|jgi:Uma2 family endonuclease|nr:Uma2 family endonuclease [Deinococcota bacterium]
MALSRLITAVSPGEYLEAEKDAEVRHEYVCGEVYAMAGGSVAHNVITGNVARLLGNAAAPTDCRVYASDMKVRVEEGLFYYPDVMVVCAPPADDYYETEPCVIVEVVSQSTSRKDRMEKRFAYLALGSLRLYLLVDSRQRAVTGFGRTPSGWEERVYGESEAVLIPCPELALTFSDIYHKVPR